MANRKIASLQTMVDHIGHNDQLSHTSSVTVGSNRVYFAHPGTFKKSHCFLRSSKTHAGLVWLTTQPILWHCTVHSTCHSLAQSDSTLCQVKTKQRNWLLHATLNALKCFNEPEPSLVQTEPLPETLCRGLYFCAEGLDILKIDKNSSDL